MLINRKLRFRLCELIASNPQPRATYASILQVVLETEVTNGGALNLYTKLGFSRNERLIKYYLNGVDAFRLKLWFR